VPERKNELEHGSGEEIPDDRPSEPALHARRVYG
jgi:hypothetical protein